MPARRCLIRLVLSVLGSLVLAVDSSGEGVLYGSPGLGWGDKLKLDGAIEIRPVARTDHSGGFSSLWVSKDCEHLITVSDYSEAQKHDPVKRRQLHLSHWYEATLDYGPDGSLRGLENAVSRGQLQDEAGRPIQGAAEGIASNGEDFIVSFDDRGVLLVYPGSQGTAGHALERRPNKVPAKGLEGWIEDGAEALTLIDRKHALVIHEHKGPESNKRRRFAWIVDMDAQTSKRVVYHNLLDPKGAATMPNGDILVLENRYNSDDGLMRIRVVRLLKQEIARVLTGENKNLEGEAIADVTANFLDNFEGIATCEKHGKQYLLIISDNNGDWDRALAGNNPQRTLLLRLELAL